MEIDYAIIAEPERNLLRIAMSGFFQEEDIRRFAAEHRTAVLAFGDPAHSHRTLVDIRGMRIQTQASVAAFARLLADPQIQGAEIAFVVDSGLARMQLVRAAGGRGRQFRSVGEAERWLMAPPGSRPVKGAAATQTQAAQTQAALTQAA